MTCKQALGAAGIFVLCVMVVSCQKLESATPPAGPLTFEPAKFADAIPSDYGELTGVTQDPEDARWVGLWFRRTDGSITAVFVDIRQGKLFQRALTIPRK